MIRDLLYIKTILKKLYQLLFYLFRCSIFDFCEKIRVVASFSLQVRSLFIYLLYRYIAAIYFKTIIKLDYVLLKFYVSILKLILLFLLIFMSIIFKIFLAFSFELTCSIFVSGSLKVCKSSLACLAKAQLGLFDQFLFLSWYSVGCFSVGEEFYTLFLCAVCLDSVVF